MQCERCVSEHSASVLDGRNMLRAMFANDATLLDPEAELILSGHGCA